MRIIYATDIHHALRQLEELFKRTDPDLYIIAGDLAYRAFYRYKTAWRLIELEQILKRYGKDGQSLLETACEICVTKNEGSHYERALEYLDLARKAEDFLKKTYLKIERIIEHTSKAPVYVLPGNYDMDLNETPLSGRNLHLDFIDFKGLRIAGYGGAKVHTPGIPEHLQVPFIENKGPEGVISEAFDFFTGCRPQILVTHEPPYGHLDFLKGYGNAGSEGIRRYIDEKKTVAVLSGHYHEQWGAVNAGGTVIFNPSNFGRTLELTRTRRGGNFLQLELKGGHIEEAQLRRLEKEDIYPVVHYEPSGSGFRSIILDEKRYAAMGGKIRKTIHIRPIRQLRKVKSFFLQYETEQTIQLIDKLESIIEELRGEGMEIAFDLLGSLNFGMAGKGSDIDLVLYLRGRDCVLDREDTCALPRPVEAVFKGLNKRDIEIDVCDSLDLDRIGRAIIEENKEDGQLQRFIFYRTVCRPVNLKTIKAVENLFLGKENFRRKVEVSLKEHIEILVSSVRHVRSFDKYSTRLREMGVKVSPDVEEAIKNYLRGRKE